MSVAHLLQETLRLWGVAGEVVVEGEAITVRPASGAEIAIEPSAEGWIVRPAGSTLPAGLCAAHPSMLGLLRELRGELAPERPRARLLIAPVPESP